MSVPFASTASSQPDVRVLFYLVRRFTTKGMQKAGVHMIALPPNNADAQRVNTLLHKNQLTNGEWAVVFDLVWRELGVSKQPPGMIGYCTPQTRIHEDDERALGSLILSMVYHPTTIPAHHFASYQAMLTTINADSTDTTAIMVAATSGGKLTAEEAAKAYDRLDRYLCDFHIAPLVPFGKSELEFVHN